MAFIHPGEPWRDTDGNLIQAHAGSIICAGGTYYLYGENKENVVPGTGIWHNGVRCYSSSDLVTWKSEGIILQANDDPASPLCTTRIMDRPHMLYCKRTKEYVMWVKFAGSTEAPHDWSRQYFGIAVSPSVTGPFHLVGTVVDKDGLAGDFTLFQAGDRAYIAFDNCHTHHHHRPHGRLPRHRPRFRHGPPALLRTAPGQGGTRDLRTRRPLLHDHLWHYQLLLQPVHARGGNRRSRPLVRCRRPLRGRHRPHHLRLPGEQRLP